VFDILITNARIIDCTRARAYPGAVALHGDRIAAVGALAGAEAKITIDAGGKSSRRVSSTSITIRTAGC
jgi:predicted amidohydrolase